MAHLKDTKALVIVTGASRGFGRCVAQLVAQNVKPGSLFILMARSKNGLKETEGNITEKNPGVLCRVASLDNAKADGEDYKRIIDCAMSDVGVRATDFETVVMVHNAGSLGNQGTPTVEMTSTKG